MAEIGELGASRTDLIGVTDQELRRFIIMGRRRKIAITAIGAAIFIMAGAAAAALGTWLEAPQRAAGRRVNVIVCGLIMVVIGIAMLGQLLRRSIRRGAGSRP